WLDGDGESPAESRDEPLLDSGHLLGKAIARDRHLLVRLEKRIEGVEELLLGAGLADEELDVVDEEQIERAVIALERIEALVLVSADYVGNELLGMDIPDLGFRVALEDIGPDRLQQVRLSQSGPAIYEERVVGRTGVLRDLDGGGARDLVRLAVDEVGERES